MRTTTIRIEEDLKVRVAAAADRAGKTAHSFILDAITQKVDQVEADDELHRLADARWANILTTGKTVDWEEAKVYLAARAQGKRPQKPTSRKLGE
nr:CopG family transcriptional regulator [Variovorax boronicumulans]